MATAANVTGQYGVRDQLNAKGIDNSRIGYNNKTGYVTIDGQNFIKPTTVTGGVSYADPTAFNQQYNVYSSQNKLNSAQSGIDKQFTQPVTNPYDTKVNDAISQYYNKITNPTPYDVYNSPEYAAYQAQAQRQAQQSTRAAQESLGAAGFGRSTNLAERAQGIQNDANEYLNTQVVPTLIAANQQKQQQELSNFANYMEMLTGQQGLFDTRTQQGRDNALNYYSVIAGQRNQYANEQYQTGRDQVADSQWNQQFNYNAGRDKVADSQWNKQYDRGVIESDRNYNRGVLESDRNYNRGVLESDRNFGLDEDSNARQWAGLDWDMQQSGNQSPQSTFTPNQVYSAIEQKYPQIFRTTEDPNTGATIAPRKPTKAEAESIYLDILNYGLSESQENDVLRSAGLTDSQIAAFDKQYLNSGK